jgi:DNA-binding GntR family transcriptional regulator
MVHLQSVFEARILIEGHCAALAAQRATPEDIADLKRAFSGADEIIARRDFRSLVRMDQVFHRSMAAATHNESLTRVVTLLHNDAARFWHFSLGRRPLSDVKTDIKYHLQVIQAIERHDAAAAETSMRAVLRLFPDSVKGMLLVSLE